MPNRIVRQWLQTDSAFGVTEVPLPHAPRHLPAKSQPPAPRPDPRPVMRAVEQLRHSPPQPHPTKPPNAPIPETPERQFAVRRASQDPMPKKPAFLMPPEALTPAGLISALPPLTRDQKIQQLADLHQKALGLTNPFLNDICTQLVFGEGDPDAPLLFVGEGPGAEEDKTGRPFVGRSGQLLDKMITAMGYTRDKLYIANVVKLRCAEPDELNDNRLKDRPPTPEEAARGLPILHQQIAIIRPKVIVTLGAPALRHLTGTTEGVTKIRGTFLSYRGIPVMPTLHPSYLLRMYTEENRRNVWNDLKLALTKI